MESIKSFVFVDIETTGLPDYEGNKTKITEISFIGSSRQQIENTSSPSMPRVLHKLTLCFNPRKVISTRSTEMSGLDNYMLEYENKFNENAAKMIINYLEHLQQPICLIAHNGNKFDFPIMQKELFNLNMSLPSTVYYVDSLDIFKEIDKAEDIENEKQLQPDAAVVEDITETNNIEHELLKCDKIDWKKINETTPSQRKFISNQNGRHNLAGQKRLIPRALFPPLSSNKKKFTLTDIYERIHDKKPPVSHYAEADVIALFKCVIAKKDKFLLIADKNVKPFSSVIPIDK